MNKNKRILLMTLIIYVIISNIHLYLYYLKNEIPSYQRCLNNQETLFKKIQSKTDLYDNIEYLDKRFFKKNPVLSTNCPDGGIFFIKDKKIHCTFHGNADNLKVKNFLSLILNKEHYLIILSEMIFSAFFLFFISYMLALNGDRIFSFFIPIIFIYIIALTRFFPFFFRFHVLQLFFTGNIRFVILSISVVCISGFFFKNIDNIRMKFLFMIFCILSFLKFGILPFYSSIPAYDDFLNSLNIYIENGLLYQSTSYSCGPAAAAIALENMG
jgi:ABC-type multidrug transport system fused ATPase/permease subunit